MQIKIKVTLFLGILVTSLAALAVVYLEYPVRASFTEDVMNKLRIIEKKNMGVYGAFIEGLKIRTVNWSSDNKIKELAQTIMDPALSLARRKAAADEFGAYLRDKKMRYDPTVLIAEILDQNGIVIASSRPKRIGTDERKEEAEHQVSYFSKAIKSGFGEAFARSAVFEEDETADPMFHLTTRLFRTDLDAKGNLIPLPAVLFVHFVSLPQLSQFLSQENEVLPASNEASFAAIDKSRTMETYVVNRDGIIVTPTHSVTIAKKKRIVTKPVSECLTDGREIVEEYLDYRGVSVIGSSSCLAEDGLVIVNEIETSEAYAIVDGLTRKTLIGGGIIFVIMTLVIFLSTRRIFSNLDKVASSMERVIKGDYSLQISVDTKDEIGHLASMFNMMIGSIRAGRKDLEESKRALEEKTLILKKDVEEHEKQQKFLEQSKSATMNLLEDSLEAKEKFEEEGIKLQSIISSVSEGLFLIDGAYRIALINPAAANMFGMTREELLGKDIRTILTLWKKRKEIIPPAEWPTEEVFLTKKIIGSTLADDFSISTDKHPDKLPVVFSIAPLGDVSAGLVVVLRDIAKDRELDEAKSGFISVASHQLRTPLTSIRWYSEMLLSQDAGPLNESQKDFMNEIHGGAERLYQTVDLLLGISRVESGKMKTDRSPIDLGVFTAAVKKELASQIEEKNLALTIVPPEREPVIVWLDSLTLRQVILNLISNAIRYTNEKGIIEIKWWLGENGEEVVYMVHDNGIGIPESVRGRIFSKFFRAENARTQVPDGSGLGLALVKDLVESWDGKVWFESKEGDGTTFFFTVPLTSKINLPVIKK